jgi:Response regulator containing CheY-like receiver domain and AraC-type DNA-binding domain
MVAENGEQGLRTFRQHLPHIVITDISMPQMDGFQLATAIKELQPETVIIATTAHSSAQSFIHSMKNGINHYIQKPVVYRELFAALDTCRKRDNTI